MTFSGSQTYFFCSHLPFLFQALLCHWNRFPSTPFSPLPPSSGVNSNTCLGHLLSILDTIYYNLLMNTSNQYFKIQKIWGSTNVTVSPLFVTGNAVNSDSCAVTWWYKCKNMDICTVTINGLILKLETAPSTHTPQLFLIYLWLMYKHAYIHCSDTTYIHTLSNLPPLFYIRTTATAATTPNFLVGKWK